MSRTLLLALCLAPAMTLADARDGLPAYLLSVPSTTATILVADTAGAALHRFANGPDGITWVDERYMSIGQNGAGKERPWDRRTPLGIYFVVDQLDTARLHEKYGPAAFPLDYPNAWDRLNRRGGDGIWIHGVAGDGERRPPLDTDGCIALANEELLKLGPFLAPLATPVIVARELRWVSRAEIAGTRDELAAALDAWADSIRDGDLHRYLSLYAAEFTYRGMTRDEWAGFRTRTLGAMRIEAFATDEVLLLADPEDDGLYLSRFRQAVVADGRRTVTLKRLYWRRGSEGLRIVAEDNG